MGGIVPCGWAGVKGESQDFLDPGEFESEVEVVELPGSFGQEEGPATAAAPTALAQTNSNFFSVRVGGDDPPLRFIVGGVTCESTRNEIALPSGVEFRSHAAHDQGLVRNNSNDLVGFGIRTQLTIGELRESGE